MVTDISDQTFNVDSVETLRHVYREDNQKEGPLTFLASDIVQALKVCLALELFTIRDLVA